MTPQRLADLIKDAVHGFATISVRALVERYRCPEDLIIAACGVLQFPVIRRAGASWVINPRASSSGIPSRAQEGREHELPDVRYGQRFENTIARSRTRAA